MLIDGNWGLGFEFMTKKEEKKNVNAELEKVNLRLKKW